MVNFKKITKFFILFVTTIATANIVMADGFMQDARLFIEQPNATAEQNQDYIARSNQFTAEGEFSAEELAELFLMRAIIFSRLNDNDNAFESYSAALQTGKLPPILVAETYKNRGLLYYSSTIYLEAKNDFKQALQILVGNAELHYYLANSYFGLLEFDDAIKQYDLALEGMANNRFLAYYGKASVFYQQHEFDKSRESLFKSLDIKGDFQPAQALLAELENSTKQAELPTISVNNSVQQEQPASDEELTANEIYNQLLEQAFAAKSQNGDDKKVSFKLNLNKNEIDNLVTNSITPEPKTPAQLLPETAKPLAELRVPNQGFSLQVSDTPYIIETSNETQRLDEILSGQDEAELSKFYLQLLHANDRKSVEDYYGKLLSKHQLLLAKRPYMIREFKDSKQRTRFQLLISGLGSYKQANSLCKFLKAQNSDCFVRQIK